MLDCLLLLVVIGRSCELELYTVHSVDTVDEQDQNEDERNLTNVSRASTLGIRNRAFIPYCIFAISGLSEMRVKSLRL